MKGTDQLFYRVSFEFGFVLCFLLIKFRLCIFVKNTIADAQLASERYTIYFVGEQRSQGGVVVVMKIISSCMYH